MEKFVDIIKLIFEKHLIPAVLGTIGGLSSMLFIRDDAYIKIKMGDSAYLLIGLISFMIVEAIVFAYHTIIRASRKLEDRRENNATKNEIEMRELHEFWSLINDLDPSDRDILRGFLASNNRPLYSLNDPEYIFSDLSQWFVITRVMMTEEISQIIRSNENEVFYDAKYAYQYKLNDGFFAHLRYSHAKHGRICDFE